MNNILFYFHEYPILLIKKYLYSNILAPTVPIEDLTALKCIQNAILYLSKHILTKRYL